MSESPVVFRNIVRYNRDVKANLPLYEALGFATKMAMDGFAVLQNDQGLKLVLHEGEPNPDSPNVTALGVTMVDNDAAAARAFVEEHGWKLIRAPDASDEGWFYVYGDLDGNPLNLVGDRQAKPTE